MIAGRFYKKLLQCVTYLILGDGAVSNRPMTHISGHPLSHLLQSSVIAISWVLTAAPRDANPQSGKIRKFGKYQNVANKCKKTGYYGVNKYMCIDLISSGSKVNLFYQFLILSRNTPGWSQWASCSKSENYLPLQLSAETISSLFKQQ